MTTKPKPHAGPEFIIYNKVPSIQDFHYRKLWLYINMNGIGKTTRQLELNDNKLNSVRNHYIESSYVNIQMIMTTLK